MSSLETDMRVNNELTKSPISINKFKSIECWSLVVVSMVIWSRLLLCKPDDRFKFILFVTVSKLNMAFSNSLFNCCTWDWNRWIRLSNILTKPNNNEEDNLNANGSGGFCRVSQNFGIENESKSFLVNFFNDVLYKHDY